MRPTVSLLLVFALLPASRTVGVSVESSVESPVDSSVVSHVPAMHAGTRDRPAATWPVSGEIVEGFVAPMCRWCPGHRGVTVAFEGAADVLAATAGIITFVGDVAGRLYVTQRLASGALVTYGDLASVVASVATGATLAEGDLVGRATGHLYLSVRSAGRHVEPLGALGLAVPRLLEAPRDRLLVGPTGAPR